MKDTKLHLLLADDDSDDCDFFKDALDEIARPVTLNTVTDGVELMGFLNENQVKHPDVIFLDLNMPRKSGMECIEEIKSMDALSDIPIIIYSTSLDESEVDRLYNMGAHHYIQKPAEFSNLKTVIHKALKLFGTETIQPPSLERFIIQP